MQHFCQRALKHCCVRAVSCKASLKKTTRGTYCGKTLSMLNFFEQMPMEPEITENLILQIFQDMKKKLDLKLRVRVWEMAP